MTTVPPVTITPIGTGAGARRLLVATPLYDGAQSDYLRAVVGLTGAAQKAGAACTFAWLSNNAAIDRARNALAAAFQQSDATHLVFIDGDIGFVPDELLDLVARMQADPELAVVGAPCPKRMTNWPLVAAAAARGLAQGNPVMLERFSGVFALDPLDPSGQYRLDQPIEVRRVGTGLMVVRRDVIEALSQRHPELRYTPDALDRESGLTGEHITALFQPMIDPGSGHHLSDDFAFCHRVRDAGFRIWIAPWMRTTHTGPARFAGTLADLAQLNAVPSPA
ncbi:glycosyltransferase family 2 protein [Erythrobacter donghaensis]|uniref:glycosyltransferase family 2 protein n=1 Tax=Erythrobacter donghaensis TaxID=267135 RepID=UPI001FE6D40E|nr:glycosyltransferase family A protein [Erythrobacter donghaensis]